MSKSVLVMKTPENCLHCPLLNSEDECTVQDDVTNLNAGDSWDELMKGCPLKLLPEEDDWDDPYDEYYTGYANGWNSCLSKITGEDDEAC